MKKLFESELCLCNGCNLILIDENPQFDAPKYEIFLNSEEQRVLRDEETEVAEMEKNRDGYWVCPVCETDDYLQDEI